MLNIFAADIGGTHSRFAHFTADADFALSLAETEWLGTADAASFGQLMENLRASSFSLKPEKADIVVIAIAGPVEEGVRSSPPLIRWDIDISNADREFGFGRCALINDFVAQAFACRSPLGKSAELILEGKAADDAAIAVIGAGTGLGHAALMRDESGGYVALPSEAGHANFPFVTRRELEFQEFLLGIVREKYITGNIVVSGSGLSYIHQFLTGDKLNPGEVAERFGAYPETLAWASRFYGRACRNYALQTLSLGGLYIAGGVAANNPELIQGEVFEAEFRSSSTLSGILQTMPVYLIRDQNSGLWGSALYGLQRLKKTLPGIL